MKSTSVYSMLALASATLLTGCAFNAKVNLSYVPAKKSALSELKPMRVSLRVDDQRPGNEPNVVGVSRGSLGATAQVLSSKKASDVVRNALKAELEHSGHSVTDTQADAADATVEVVLKRFSVEVVPSFFDVALIGGLNSDISIARPPGTKRLEAYAINATSTKKSAGYEAVLNNLLAEFVRSFSLDPKVIEVLRGDP